MTQMVRVEVSGPVATVTLDRPNKLNAMDFDCFRALAAAGLQVEADAEVRCVVVRGNGRAFSAGIDLSALGSFQEVNAAELNNFVIPEAQEGFRVWSQISKPVIAAVQGYALGAGLQLALAADIRIAADDAVFSVPEITYGIIPDLGATQRLPRLIGPARAKELIWTGKRIDAATALDWGLCNEVVPVADLPDRAMQWAHDLSSRPPLPLRYTKKLIDDSPGLSILNGMDDERAAQLICLMSDDARAAIESAMTKQPAEYKGR